MPHWRLRQAYSTILGEGGADSRDGVLPLVVWQHPHPVCLGTEPFHKGGKGSVPMPIPLVARRWR